MRHLILALVVLVACDAGEHRDARDKYNEGIAALAKGDFDDAEKALLEARSTAGVDPELRFRAAYDLGVCYAAHADRMKAGMPAAGSGDKAGEPDLAKALELEQQAASWFGDAARLKKDDADTQANLAIVRARVQAISDDLRKGEGKLEARLDALIGDERSVLDDARGAWVAIKQAGGSDPLAQQGTLTHLADKERGIVAEAGVIGDLASDEIDAIGKKPQDKRSQEEQVRVVQLKNLDLYLLDGRSKIAEARRKLQELAAEEGVTKSEAALVALKRAREQLLDPIAVLQALAQDEAAIEQETKATIDPTAGKLQLGDAAAPKPQVIIPSWLQPPAIAERQSGVHDRLGEVRARFQAALEHADAPGAGSGSAAPPPPSPSAEQQKVLDRVRAALPAVGEAAAAMETANTALGVAKLADADKAEIEALIALARAIEQFADLKHTIELAWQHHQRELALLSPEAAKQLAADERTRQSHDEIAGNIARVERIKELLADEGASVAQQESKLPPVGAGSGSGSADPKQAKADEQRQQLAAAKEQLARAETLRGEAASALADLAKAITANSDPMVPAKLADTKLTELRKLFFSVIEHLQELIRNQSETRDQTAATAGEDDFARAPKLPGLIGRQTEHHQLAKAITDALAAQADAASKQPPQQGAPPAKALSGAADEVRQAQGDMLDSGNTLAKAKDATNHSESLDPSVKSQAKAIEHLEAALKLLQPPQKNDKQDKQPDQQKQQQPKPKEEDKQPQGGAGQRARDEDAKRQRDKREKQPTSDDVDQDW